MLICVTVGEDHKVSISTQPCREHVPTHVPSAHLRRRALEAIFFVAELLDNVDYDIGPLQP